MHLDLWMVPLLFPLSYCFPVLAAQHSAEVVEQTLEGAAAQWWQQEMGKLHLLSPLIFSLIQMGSSFLHPAIIVISEPRTAFGSPNSHLGCHLVLSAETRENSQGAWSCQEENNSPLLFQGLLAPAMLYFPRSY